MFSVICSTDRPPSWQKEDRNETRITKTGLRVDTKQEFCEQKVVTNKTRTKLGQSKGKKWTEDG